MSIRSPNPAPSDVLDVAIVSFLLAEHPSPVHRSVLERAFAGDDWPSRVAALEVDGLLHREGDLLLVSRAATRMDELAR